MSRAFSAASPHRPVCALHKIGAGKEWTGVGDEIWLACLACLECEHPSGTYSRERSICIENVNRSAGCVVTEISKASLLASR